MKKGFLVFILALCGSSAMATNMGSYGLTSGTFDFAAPVVGNKAKLDGVQAGAIVYEYNGTVGGFYGLPAGQDPTTGTWVSLGGAGPRSEVTVYGSTNHGSTNTAVRVFSNAEVNTGSNITYATNGATGDTFTINTTGLYNISYTDLLGTMGSLGVSRNSNQLSTSINSITQSTMVTKASGYTSTFGHVSRTLLLNSGDIIRAHDDGACQSDATVQFSITKVNN